MNPFLLVALTALIPLIIGFVWYNPKVFGTAWMNATGLTQEKMQGANMPLIFGLTYVLSFILCFGLAPCVIHQFGFFSMMNHDMVALKDTNSDVYKMVHPVIERYGHEFRSLRHGALHGGIVAIFLFLPVIAINALFERRGFKYIAIHVGYWFVCSVLMGAIICKFLALPQ